MLAGGEIIPPGGPGLFRKKGPLNLGRRGELGSGDAGNRAMTTLGVRPKKPTVNSSTMRGAKALGGKRRRRRCRTALERPSSMGKGTLLGSIPRNRTGLAGACAETMPLRERWTYGDWSSDVTGYAERPTNRGRTGAAGVMPGACLVRQVLQTPQSGRVLQVGVRLWAKRCSRQGSRGPLAVLQVVLGT